MSEVNLKAAESKVTYKNNLLFEGNCSGLNVMMPGSKAPTIEP